MSSKARSFVRVQPGPLGRGTRKIVKISNRRDADAEMVGDAAPSEAVSSTIEYVTATREPSLENDDARAHSDARH